MVRTSIDLQFSVHCVSKLGFWQHTPNGRLNEALWLFFPDLRSKFFAKTARISAIAAVEFLVFFAASHSNTGSINDDDVVTGVQKGRISRAVLSLEESGSDCRQATQYL